MAGTEEWRRGTRINRTMTDLKSPGQGHKVSLTPRATDGSEELSVQMTVWPESGQPSSPARTETGSLLLGSLSTPAPVCRDRARIIPAVKLTGVTENIQERSAFLTASPGRCFPEAGGMWGTGRAPGVVYMQSRLTESGLGVAQASRSVIPYWGNWEKLKAQE